MKIFLLVAVFAVSLMVIGVGGGAEVQHAGDLGQAVASDPTPYHLTGGAWSILDLSAPQSGYAFAQTPDSTSLTAGAFVTTWRTTSADKSITLPLVGTDITINWGDGNTTAGVSTPVDHIYNTAGDYTVQITGGLTWFHLNNAADASKLVSLDQWGTASWASMENAFSGASNMVYNAGDAPDLSGVTDMSSMFDGATAFDGDLSSWDVSSVTEMDGVFAVATSFNQTLNAWDVSSVTDMNNMFYYATSFNQPLNAWDVSSVTYMNDMFHDAASFNQPLNAWDVSSVTSMNCMFLNAHAFNQPLNAWDVSSVSNMNCMFYGATSFDQPLNDWDVSSVTAMNDMFLGATAFDQDLANWYVVQDLPPVLTAYTMFPIRAQNSYLDGLVSTYSIVDTRFVMDGKTLSLNSTNLPPVGMYPLDITAPAVLGEPNAGEKGHTRTLSVTVKEHRPFITTWTATDSDRDITLPMVGTYSVLWGDGSHSPNVNGSQSYTYGAAGDYAVTVLGDGLEYIRLHGDDANALQLKSIDQWGDTRWTTMDRAFYEARNMVYNATDTPDLSGVTDMSVMFFEASSFNGDLSSWDVSSVTDMSGMFAGASSFNQPLNAWDVSSVTDMLGMFSSASSFDQPLNAWDVSSVTEMSGMFAVATSFNQPLNTWDVSLVSDMGSMFAGATAFDQDLANWYVVQDPPVLTANAMFSIRAQNSYLDDLVSTYSINDTRFVMDGKILSLNFTNLPPAGMYPLDITAPAVLGEPNAEEEGHTRTLIVTVKEHRPFITTWTASDSDRDITLPMVGTYSVLWGDGSHSPNVNGSQSHMYGAAGDYAVTVLGDGLEYIRLHGDDANALQLKSIDQWGDTRWTTMDRAFYEARNMVYNATDSPDLSGVTDMSGMFLTARAFNGDLSSWNVSSIRDMHNMFGGARAFNGDLSSWDVSSVTSMSNMFGNARAFNGDLSSWDVSSVTNMTSMFRDASTFDRPLNVWDVSSVTDMSDMFGGASSFNQTLSSWNVSSVTDMSVMFFEASSFNGDLSSWDVSSVTDMNAMFFDATAFDGDLSSWDVSSVSDMGNMFFDATAFNQSLNYWDVSSVTNMHEMFYGAISFNQPLNDWDVSSINSTFNMFYGTTAFNQPLNDWDVSSVTDMFGMFAFATAFDQPLNDWDVSSVTDMFNMFYGATSFDQPLNAWDVSAVTNMHEMFYGAISFNQPLNAWDVSSVSDMGSMFAGTTAFDQDLSGWYVVQDPPVLTANAMFSIRAQNGYLDDLVSTYFIVDTRFVMDGKILSLNSTNLPPAGIYPLDITAPAVLGEPNAEEEGHTRTLIVTVKGEHQPFITTWRTTTADQSITINFVGSGMNISWGDGMTETNLSGSRTHTYEDAGDYRVSVTGGLTGLTLERQRLFAPVPELASIDQWGGISWTNMSNAFAGASNMTYRATDTPDLSLVTDMSNMFETATAFDGDLSSWDVSSVTGMSGMFAGAASFNQPLNDWDVSSVTSMNCMFVNAHAFNQPLNDWDVSSVSNMNCMFWDANSFNHPLNDWDVSSVRSTNGMFLGAYAFNHPLNAWDVSSVSNMNSMFYAATSFNHPLNAWDVSKVTDMGGVFFAAHAFNHPLNDWDVSSVTNMHEMFASAFAFNHPLNDWDVSSVTTMNNMFRGAAAFNQDLSSWYITPDSAVLITDRSRTLTVMPLSPYIGEQSLGYTVSDAQFVMNGRTLSLSSADTPTAGSYDLAITAITVLDEPNASTHTRTVTITVSDPPAMPFITTWRTDSANQTITIPVGGSTARYSIDWGDNSPAETDITGDSTHTYREADSYTVSISGGLERIYLDGQQPNAGRLASIEQWGDMYWTSMSGAFDGAYNMVYNATDTPDLGLVSDMSRMFAGAVAFDGEISEWDVSAVRDMSGMFDGATSFDQPLNDWDVLTVRDISGMFDGATSFDQPLNDWDVLTVRDMSGMFDGATSFDQPLNDWDVLTVRDMSGMFDGATSFDQLLNSWNVSSVRDMSDMFAGATSFNQPLNSWNVSSVRDMSSIFDGATLFDRPLDDWDVSSTTDMTRMFAGATSFNRPLDDWDISAATGMSGMFAGATAFDQNLSGWYVTLDGPAVIIPGHPRTPEVLPLSPYLDGHLHTYSVNNPQFVVAGRTLLLADPDSPPTAGNYQLDITTAAILGEPNTGSHTGTFEITVRDPVVRPFITTWMTDAANQTVTIPGTGQGHTCNIDWGDGTVHLDTSCRQTHIYAVAGTHTVSISGGLERFHLDNQQPNAGRLASIEQWGDIRWTSMRGAFDSASNMVYLATDAPDLSLVSDMSDMFIFATSFNGDLSSWDVSAVTDMSSMFNNAYDFNGDLSSWDVSSVTNMLGMFNSATSFDQPLKDWDVSAVTDMSNMFFFATSFDQLLNDWDVSKVTDMSSMFRGATDFNQPLNDWDVSKVTSMIRMFHSASSFNQTISTWDVSAVTGMHRMFYVATDFNQPLNSWNVSSVRDMSGMFDGATFFDQPLKDWDVSSVTSMLGMFDSATSFDQLLNDWDVSKVTDMSSMFRGATSFDQPLNDWDVSKVTRMASMFFGTSSFNQNLGNWYVVANATSIARADVPRVVAEISAQNGHLNGHNPTYGISSDNDYAFFEIVNGNKINMTSVGTKSSYMVNVTASGSNVFESGNNWRLLEITVRDSTNSPPVVQAGDDQTVGEGDTVTLSGSVTPDGDPITYAWSQTNPDAPPITFANASASSTTFVAPAVTSDTTFIITLTANGGGQSVEDTLKITVKETSTAFITTWTASDSDKSITLPMKGMYSILWGDGSNSTNVSDSQSHTYSTAGTYTVTVLGDGLKSISLFSDNANALQIESIEQWGGTEWTTMDDAFEGASNMVYRATDAPDLSKVTHTSGMFWGASSFDGDLSGWNVSSVTNMFGMFSSASSFNQTLNSWDVSSVTDMSYMFFGASSFDQPLNSWNVSSVTGMTGMFEGATSFNQPLNRWNVSSVIGMGMIFMFHNADDFDQNLGNWYVVANATSIARADVPGVVAEISAQNDHLNGHNPTYGIGSDNDYAFFEIVNGNKINMTSVGTKSSYMVNVTASGSNVFESGNNWRLLEIKVTGQTTDTTSPVIKLEGSSLVTITVDETYTEQGAVCDDDVDADKPATVGGDTVDISTVGQYTVTYNCTDEAGNNAPQVSRTVNVEATPPTFVSSELDPTTGVLTIIFSETIDVTPAAKVDATKIHIRESGNYTGGVTLTAGELGTAADASTISFTLTRQHQLAVAGLAAPELTIEPGAVQGIFENLIVGTFDVSTAAFVHSFNVSSQDTSPRGMAFSNNGLKMFVVGWIGEDINEYTLDTPFDVSTASFDDVVFSVLDQERTPTGMAFSNDGLKMFVVGTRSDAINEYTLITPFDLSTASYAGNGERFSVSGQDDMPTGVAFSNDGAKMFVVGAINGINEYTLDTPFDVSTASFDDVVFSVSMQETVPTGVAFSNDGTKMFVVGTVGNAINEYTLNTPFNISVVTHVDSFSVSSREGSPKGVAFSNDGAKMFVVGTVGDAIYEYTLSSVYPITVTVRDVNVAPVLNTIGDQTVNEFVELTFTATASDDDSLTFSFDGTFPSGAAITSAGVFTWTPTESQDGDHTITVQVTDGSLTDSETLTVTVNEVNVAPVLNAIGDKGTSELVELTFTATASDTDVVDNVVNTLTFSFDGTFPSGAAITDDGNFTWTPTESQVGSHDITVQVTDGSLTDSETLTVTVRDVNVAPVLNTIDDQTVNEFVELTFTATASDDDSLTFSFDGTFPSGAAITDDGNFTWTPTELQDGDHTITVQVTDGSLTDSETLTVTVNEVNVAPVLNAIGDKGTSELVELTFTATASDTDVVDNVVNTLTFSFDGTFPSGAAITDDGNFTWTPTESQVGSHDITVQVTDGSLTDSETVTVTVHDVNVAPVLNTIDDQTVNEFVELTFTATASDDDSLTFSFDGTFPSGAAITSAGVFTWTPTESQDGDHTITVQVTDGSLTDSETLTVTVNEVNVAPVLNAIGDKGTSELVELTFTATASDTDVVDNVVNTLTFSFDGTFPSGAAITSAGVFTWIPTESQVGSHDITVQVTDGSLTDSETLTVTVRDVNVAPVLNTIDDQTVNEFVELTFTATASDDDSLTFSFDGTFPSGAAITDDGNFTWTPTESQDGDHTITVQVTDGSLTDSETLTVTVNEVNVAPVLNAIGDKGTSELVELTFTATASDTDVVDNVVNTLTFSFDGTFPLGAAITSAGVFTWIPTESQVGSHDITVQVTDGSLTDSETLTVTVRDVNVAPVLNTIDDQTVNEFVELTFTATASDDDSLTFSFDGTFPSGAAITDDGNFTWTPTELQDGDHTITVQVTDGSLTDSETLTVTVNEVNVAPVLNAIGDKGTSELVELTFTATASDTDVVDNVVNTLTFSFDGTFPLGAAITDDGNFTWTPTESQVGSHDITVQVTDGSLTDSETLTVTVRDVNVAPVLNTIDDQTVNEFVELTFTATASDDDSLTFSFDGTFPSGAAITDDGNFTWTPTELQDGDHTITVQVTDGSLTDSETLTVTVNEVNVAPVLNAIGDKGTSELVELTFTATASDTDVVDNVVNTLTFSFDGTFPLGAAITDDGNFTWTPTESQVGSHDITVQVTDGSLTDSETLTVTVRDVNVAPVLNTIDDQTVNEFVELTFTATASDDDSLTFSFDGTFPSGAAITDDGNFTWTPTELQDGDHTITVQVTDGSLTDSETLTVTVNEVNVAPVLNAIGDKGTSELVELTFTATASDTDVVDNVVNTLTFSFDGTFPLGAAITDDGNFTWTPTESQVGSHDITVQVTDGSLTDSETLTVTVRDVNVAPVLNTIDDQTVNEFVELTFTATASDDDSLTFSFDGTFPSGAAITDDGNFTWTPTESQDGDHTITVQVTDGSLTDSETLTVTVNEVNVAPVLNAIGDKGTSKLVELTFTATASDTDVVDNLVNTLTFSFDGTVPSGAAITDDGNFTWTPTESQVGSHDITVQVTDGSLTDSETLTVTVRDVNVAPVLNTIDDQTVNEFVELTFTATASDDDSLTFSFDGTFPSGAAITDDGNFTWTPTELQDGDHTITVQVTDGSLTDSETLTVTVNEVNVAPVLNAIGDKGTSKLVELTFTATASDTDVVDNLVNTLTFSFDGTFPSGAAITDDGNFTWTPTESQDGDHTITVQVTDGSLTDSETLTVTVRDVNVAPVLNTIDDQTVNEFVELTFTATASDDDSLTFSFDGTVPSGAAITDDGNFTWTPTELQDGDHTITVQVTDGSLTDSETLTVTVNEVNVAPVLNAIGDKGTSELVELTFTATASDTDVVDNLVNTLTFSFDGTFPLGAAITSAGVFTWTPTESQVGSHDITVQVTDGSLTDSETLTVTVKDTTAPRRITLSADAFITTWRTDSANQTITIPVGGSTAKYSIDWGDNSPAETDITGDSTHTYREADSYTVSISGGLERFHLDGQQPNAGRLASIEQWGDTRWTTMDAAFDGATNMVYRATDTPDLSGVTDMHRMFGDATAFNGDLSSWDVSKVTDMSNMFIFAYDFNGNLSSWNVSSVTNMNEMFAVATSFNQPLNSWNVSRVTNMDDMFYFATAFSQNLGNWYVVANATSIARADVPGVVAEISAQNDHLNGHNPTYGISRDNDYAFFEIVNGNKINMTSVGTKSSYMVNVTASGSNVFEDGNNWRMLVVRVTGDNNADLGSLTISSGTLSPQFSSSDITYTASVDNSVTQVTVTPTASDSSATITVNDNIVPSGTGHILTGLNVGTNTVTVIVTAQDSTTKTYIITLTRAAALSGNADLGSLTISSGTLSPQFSSSDITYTASVDNSVTQVTVTPTASDSSATIAVNGNTVTSGTGHILTGLTVGTNTVTVIVTAQDSTTKTYIITLTRAALSDNADLGSLTISSGTLSPQFSSSDITYTASVDNSVTQVTVTPTASDSSATITVNDNIVPSGTGHILTGLTVGTTTVTVIVTAQDSTTKTYTITLTRAAALSGNANLGGLTISSGTLSPQFSSSDITYTASVDNSVTQVTVTPTASDSSATITVNGNTVTSGTGHILTGLTVGTNTVTVIVTAQDSTTKTYTITLTRAAALSDNANLGSLTISSGTLSPQFSSSVTAYTASVDNSVTQVTVTPTASDSLATITVNGNTVTSGTGHILTGLTVGTTTVTVIVTAQDSTTKTYIITLTRAALSDNADLDGLTISSGTLSPQFSSSDITYTASVDNSVTQVTVTPTASDSSATITVNGNTVTSGIGYIVTGLTVDEPNTVTVIVTAQDSTTKTYIITLTRAAATLSDNADLDGLTISSGTLSPQFSSSVTAYTASVDNSVTQVTVTPTASDSSATITVNGNTVTSGTGHILTGLTVGTTTVTVIVTAQDSTTKTYIITLTRAALSDNADLGGLTISSGTLSPQFSSSDITYTASVDNSVTQVTVTPTASDSSATITVNGNTVTSGIGYIVTGLTVDEPNTVTVIVTAQDSTTKTYIITLTRAAATLSDNADLGGLTISSGTLSPQFSSSDITYTASVDNSVTQVTVTPTASDSSATITVNGNTVTSGTGHILTGLTVGTNTVTVIVTAQDSTTKTYTITLTRAAALSDNANLGSLTISSGTLSPQFSSSVTAYTASVDNSVTQVTVTPTASDSSATITVNGNTVTSGIGYIVTGLTVDEPNTVTVIVTAQDSTTKTYIITVTRAAATLSDNADLGGLTISSGTLSPQFSSSDITYTASVDNSVTQVTVTPTASDSSATITVNGNTVTSGIGYIVIGLIAGEPNTVTVIVTAQDSTTKTYIITVTVRDVPITVSSAAYNPGNGQLTITFNQDIATVDYSGLHVRSSANPDTGGITLSSVTDADYSGRTITATLDSEQQDQYDALQSPHLVVEDGAVTDTDGDRTTDVPPQPIRDASQKGSSSSSKAPIMHINTLAQSRLVDIPPHITEQVESHDASDPLEPITPDGTFDLPLVINGYGYLLDAYENTLIPQTVTAGDNPVHITFTVYTEKEFAHFILYLNLQGRNTNYADSDTYITYKDDGTTSVTDPHGYIGSATVTVTQEDDQIPEKRTVRITIEFGEEPMGPTNMVAYMWNTDREALFVKIIDALEVVAASPESAMQAADPEPLEPDSVLPADPELVTPDFADDAADPEPVPYDILGPDDYDDTQILQIIRMWSGFESESITDEQLLELLGLEDYQGADIPDWMMTELGVLVAKGDVTVDEFMLALQYVLEHV